MVPIQLEKRKIEKFCKKPGTVYLALFGSVLTAQFNEKSDVDVLVNFEKEHIPHLIGFGAMESELSDIIGYPVDLKALNDLSPYFREDVLTKARAVYAE